MKEPVVLIGIGQLANVFAHGFLRSGHPVYPITRKMNMPQECGQIPPPCLVVVMVAENELHPVLEYLPEPWRDKVVLLQNELLPRDWEQHRLENPTITVVWFEKKKSMPLTNVLYTPVYGPGAPLIGEALREMEIPVLILEDEEALLYELVRKGLYILTVNIAGLANNCTVGDLWKKHQELAISIADEVITIQEWLTGQPLPREKLIAGLVEGIEDCPDRYCLCRTAKVRLERALGHAREAGIETPKLKEIYSKAQQ